MPTYEEIDSMMDIADYGRATLLAAADRTQASLAPEHMIYREAELDEIWRLIDMDRAKLVGDDHDRLSVLRDLVHRAHDLVGQDEDAPAAAAVLREAAALA